MAWSTQPVLFVSVVMALAGKEAEQHDLTFDLWYVQCSCRSNVGVSETRDPSILERDRDMANTL